MLRFILRLHVHLRTATIRVALTATLTVAIAASPSIAQQAPPATPQQQITPTELPPQSAPPAQGVTGLPNAGAAPSVPASAPELITNPPISTLPISRIVACQESHCGHVIDLLIRNRMRQQTGAPGSELAPGLFLTAPPSVSQFGDLELLNVNLVSHGSPGQGPVIQLDIRNNSTVDVGDFQISVVGVLRQIHAHSPAMRATVSRILTGAVATFQLQLPATAMAMGLPGEQPASFDTLVVAIDSFDELVEANELNNVRIIRRADLLPIIIAPTPVSTVVPPVAAEGPATAPPADTAIPSPAQPASPLDSLLLEDRRLETTQPTATGMTEHFRGTTL